MFSKVLILFVYVLVSEALFEGERCIKSGSYGVCKNLNRCQAAIDDLKRRVNPQICSFDKTDPIVCCLDGNTAGNPVATTTRRPPPTSTTEYIPPVYDYENVGPTDSKCEPISESMTIKKTGRKALDKCIEYQEKYVYPCGKGVALTGELSRSNKCHHNADELIIGGTDAAQYEFPHMVMMGYGANIKDLQFVCGGALISDRFVLTAGHCTFSRDLGPITYVLVGALRRSDVADRSKIYKVKNILKHPEYQSPSTYNDIALIETERVMELNQFTVPACLHTGDVVNDTQVLATGWGNTQGDGNHASEILQKVVISKFPAKVCSKTYKASRQMKSGYNDLIQSCYGDKDEAQLYQNRFNLENKDTCQGDSGGPIQIKDQKIHCMYTIVGVTSIGRPKCGHKPGIYTRVAQYLSWIERTVWPN